MPTPPKTVLLSKKRIGERIRALREERGLSQTKLARLLGSHPQSLYQIERGIRGLTIQQVVKLSRALKISTDEILGQGKLKKPLGNGARRFMHRLHRILELPSAQQEAMLKMIDGALQMHGAPAQRD